MFLTIRLTIFISEYKS